MKYCKMEDCQHCEYSTWAEMYVCTLTNEEVFEDTECDLGSEEVGRDNIELIEEA